MVFEVGDVVGSYHVTAKLGQGGMATVFQAKHVQLDRDVAIKVMHQNFLEDEGFRMRFRREAQIVASLEHPHIVPVYDFNEESENPYLVMKYIQGKTLKEHLSRGVLSLDQIVHVMTAVADALTYAHRKGVLHRDIKPSNIVIDSDNVPYLADFGLARIAKAGESTMSADMLLGTPLYISPEQAKGQKNLDGRADIYSLGIVLYELVVGRVPYSADTPYSIIHDHIYTPLPLPSSINEEIPPDVEDVLLKALAKQPEERFDTANEMINAFRQALNQADLTELDSNRASIATERFEISEQSRLNELSQQATITGDQNEIPFPAKGKVMQTGTIVENYVKDKHGRRWIIGGIVAFILIVFASFGVFGNMMQTLSQIENLTIEINNDSGTLEVRLRDLAEQIPELSVEEALQQLADSPENATYHLSLARAYWQDGQSTQAYQAIQDGKQHSPNTVDYFLSATAIAEEFNYNKARVAYAVLAFNEATKNLETVPSAGRYLYEAAAQARDLDIAQTIREISSDEDVNSLIDSATVKLIVAKNAIEQNRLNIANRALNEIDENAQSLPEVRLVYGELYLAQGELQLAANEWEQLLTNPDSPTWIKERVGELLPQTEDTSR